MSDATEELDMEASVKIISISASYIIVSVLMVAIGAVSTLYGALVALFYGFAGEVLIVFLGFFLGIALIIIGVFLTFWGLYWMRREGRRLRKKLEKRKTAPSSSSSLEKSKAGGT
jgi:hypothetical protein